MTKSTKLIEDHNGLVPEADLTCNPLISKTFDDIIDKRYNRRSFLKTTAATTAGAAMIGTIDSLLSSTAKASTVSLKFEEIQHTYSPTHTVAPGYRADVILRWGDKLHPEAPNFNASNLKANDQDMQFGYNTDFIGYMPLPKNTENSEQGLLGINNEYCTSELMFPGVKKFKHDQHTKEMCEYELSALGFNVVEVKKENNQWKIIEDSPYNRKFSGRKSSFKLTGPVAGNDRVKTSKDASGTNVVGTYANCSGGQTPWGTFLSGEENFQGGFSGTYAKDHPEAVNGKRYGINGRPWQAWGRFIDRFHVEKEPNEPNRFGWIVEIDPYDPESTPVKRTALGRFRHEGAGLILNHDNRVVVYMGDDSRFEYIYRYVSNDSFIEGDLKHNNKLLDEGVLSVAKFHENGKLEWKPLVYGKDPLNEKNGFSNQADILIESRRAADLVGATPMDRPESVTPNPVNNKVYAVLTKNKKRTDDEVDSANPRAKNYYGHIIEFTPAQQGSHANHTADEFTWKLFLKAGNPAIAEHDTKYHHDISENGWFVNPDNCTFDNQGRMWVTTDSGGFGQKNKVSDGLYACDANGDGCALTKHFFSVPQGAEMTGPCFTPDNKTLFLSVQHPGDEKGSSFESPTTRWPDFDDNTPPRPSVVAITKDDGDIIGS